MGLRGKEYVLETIPILVKILADGFESGILTEKSDSIFFSNALATLRA